MNILINIIVFIIALLHFYFLILEMFLWTSPIGLKIFGQTLEQAKQSARLAANQGLYNGFLVAGLIWGIFSSAEEQAREIKIFFLSCVIVAGLYGAWSVNRKIFFIQALPAIVALSLMLISF
ncbi:MAG: DUF1304 domain-containing protein [Oligoflexia bacterium]|nr:DUF1304 domain-containing protein [Oligoflexia bacterium]